MQVTRPRISIAAYAAAVVGITVAIFMVALKPNDWEAILVACVALAAACTAVGGSQTLRERRNAGRPVEAGATATSDTPAR